MCLYWLLGQAGEWNGKAVVVNVSSLAAVQPFASWGVYCAGRSTSHPYTRWGHFLQDTPNPYIAFVEAPKSPAPYKWRRCSKDISSWWGVLAGICHFCHRKGKASLVFDRVGGTNCGRSPHATCVSCMCSAGAMQARRAGTCSAASSPRSSNTPKR